MAHCDMTGPGSGRRSTSIGGIPHNGINTTLRKISERHWWRRLVEDVRSYCKNCSGCHHIGAAVPINVGTPVDNSCEADAGEKVADAR